MRNRKDYMRQYQRVWIADRRKAWFADKHCVQCGSTERLELDHIDPATKVASQVWSWAKERREAELAKCQVLCESCHMEKTKAYLSVLNRRPITHGTVAGYTTRACRCAECSAAERARKQRYRERKRLARLAPAA